MQQQAIEVAGHTSAITAFLGWIAGVLPPLATFVTVVWFSILITEKVTGKTFHELVRGAYRKVFKK